MADKALESYGQNIKGYMAGTVLHLQIETAGKIGPSKSGKTEMVATTGGAFTVNGVKVGVNAYRAI